MKSPNEPWTFTDWIVALLSIGILFLGAYAVAQLTGNVWWGVVAYVGAWVFLRAVGRRK